MVTLESDYNLLATSKLRLALVIRRTVTISAGLTMKI